MENAGRQFKKILTIQCLHIPMTEKKGFMEKIFGKKESCCCGPKIVPKTDTKKSTDEKKESQE